jgi:pSer/pThr/pTyr-binding forkhead associated (FHA) protein
MIFRHITGSRATEIDIVPFDVHREVILGRAQSAAVRFHGRDDIAVGRYHARIVPTPNDPLGFLLTDLESRNGTFVNGARVEQPVVLRAGDILRLGEHGPEIEVSVELSVEL